MIYFVCQTSFKYKFSIHERRLERIRGLYLFLLFFRWVSKNGTWRILIFLKKLLKTSKWICFIFSFLMVIMVIINFRGLNKMDLNWQINWFHRLDKMKSRESNFFLLLLLVKWPLKRARSVHLIPLFSLLCQLTSC